MRDHRQHWWNPRSLAVPPEAERTFQVYYDDQGRDILVKEYDPQGQEISITRLTWGSLNQVRIQKNDTRRIGSWRRWVWRMIERFLVQRAFQRSLWQKIVRALLKPDFLIRSERLDAKKKLQEYSVYVYFPDGSLAGVDQYSADGTYLGFVPIE